MRANRFFELLTRLFVLTLRGVENGEVVVGLGQLRIVPRQRGENVDRFRRLVLLREDQPFGETSVGIARLLREILVDALERLRVLALLEKAVDVLELVGVRERREQDPGKKKNDEPRGEAGGEGHCAILFRVKRRTHHSIKNLVKSTVISPLREFPRFYCIFPPQSRRRPEAGPCGILESSATSPVLTLLQC